MSVTSKATIGCILGTAVGDALGLPYEGLRQTQIRSVAGYNLIFGKGMVSDDTEHTCMVAQALIVSAGREDLFRSSLAWRFRWWLLTLPVAVGYATLRAIVKLWFGFSPRHSGVFSAGNGAAMRAALLGVCYGDDLNQLFSLVRLSTRITHTDPKAEYGSLSVAIAAYLASQNTQILPPYYYKILQAILPPEAGELLDLIQLACESSSRNEEGTIFAANLGLNKGISGYIYHTVPIVIQIWLRHQQDYPTAIKEVIRLGGDTDTTAAILGGIIGARVGKQGIPSAWLDNLWEYPRSVVWMENLARRLAEVCINNKVQKALPLPILPLLIRNLFFFLIVITHGFLRLFLLFKLG